MLTIPREILSEVFLYLEVCYPGEGCGLVLVRPGETCGWTRFRRCTNDQDRLHALNPLQNPRTSRSAYSIHPKELLVVDRELRKEGETIRVICHSHPDVGVYFSDEDFRQSVVDGLPLYPDAAQMVVSVLDGKAVEFGIFEWDDDSRRFLKTSGGPI